MSKASNRQHYIIEEKHLYHHIKIELVDMTSRFRTIDEVCEVTTKPIIFDGDLLHVSALVCSSASSVSSAGRRLYSK